MSKPVCTCAMRPWRPMRPCPVHARRDKEPPERVWIRHGMDVFTKSVPDADEYVLAELVDDAHQRLRSVIEQVWECVHPGFPIETRDEMRAVIEGVRDVVIFPPSVRGEGSVEESEGLHRKPSSDAGGSSSSAAVRDIASAGPESPIATKRRARDLGIKARNVRDARDWHTYKRAGSERRSGAERRVREDTARAVARWNAEPLKRDRDGIDRRSPDSPVPVYARRTSE